MLKHLSEPLFPLLKSGGAKKMNLIGRLWEVMGENMACASLGPGSVERAAGHAGHLPSEQFSLSREDAFRLNPHKSVALLGMKRKWKSGRFSICKGFLRFLLVCPGCGPLSVQFRGDWEQAEQPKGHSGFAKSSLGDCIQSWVLNT